MKPLHLIILPLLIAACVDPGQACRKEATKDLQTVRALIEETEQTIARGYAIKTGSRNIAYTDFCLGTGHSNVGVSFCNRIEPVRTEKPVAVDLNEERRKLASLRQKEAELSRNSAIALQRCELANN